MTITDQDGHPVATQGLGAGQTAAARSVVRTFDPGSLSGLTPARLARILRQAEDGDILEQSALFETMEERDPHLYAEVSKRKRALLTLPWEIQPARADAPEGERRMAREIREMLRDLPDLEDVVLDLADAIGKGFSCLEMTWRQEGKRWLPGKIEFRPQTWFQLDREVGDAIRLRDGSTTGQELRPFTWLTHIHKAKSGYLSRSGLYRILAWPYLAKHYAVNDLAEFIEVYGMPLRLGRFPESATQEQRSALLRALADMGHNAAGAIPAEMSVEFHDASGGRGDPFQAMIDWAERAMSKAILGGTLTSQADGKSSTNALGNVHNEVRHDIMVSDARQIAGTLTRDLVYPLAALHFPGVTPATAPRFVFDTSEPDDISILAGALPQLSQVLRLSAAHFRDRLGLPEPVAGEELVGPWRGTAAPGGNAPNGLSWRGGQATLPDARPGLEKATDPLCKGLQSHVCQDGGGRPGAASPDAADRYATQAAAAALPALAGLLAPVRDLVASAGSLEEIRSGLFQLYPTMDAGEFGGILMDALMAAELAGRFEVSRGG